jgi:hypothetical protein
VGHPIPSLRNESYCAFGAYDQGPAFGERRHRVEGVALFFLAVDAARVERWAEVEDEILADDEEALGRERLDVDFFACTFLARVGGLLADRIFVDSCVVGYGGEVGLGMDVGEGPGFAAVFCES